MKKSWEGSKRLERLPSNWKMIRLHVLTRDSYLCQVNLPDGSTCRRPATEVDHIEHGDNHAIWNLRAICVSCHKKKSGQEGNQAMNKKRRATKERFRRSEAHPSSL